ncbi:hypothetical protein FRC09_001095 [Ceratobasidium sp. 395]|nr:hypothetical protein FRC09_001095 [Ceratobasidium sp. 395]
MSKSVAPTKVHWLFKSVHTASSDKQVTGVSISIYIPGEQHARYSFHHDERKILTICSHTVMDVHKALTVYGEEDVVPLDMSKYIQLTWIDSTLRITDLGSSRGTYFLGKVRQLEPHFVYTVAEKPILRLGEREVAGRKLMRILGSFVCTQLLKVRDCIIINFVYKNREEVETAPPKSRSGHSQVTSSVTTQPRSMDGSDSVSECSPEASNRVYIDLTATEDSESDAETDDVVFLKAVYVRDHPQSTPSGEGGRVVNQPPVAQVSIVFMGMVLLFNTKVIDRGRSANASTETKALGRQQALVYACP